MAAPLDRDFLNISLGIGLYLSHYLVTSLTMHFSSTTSGTRFKCHALSIFTGVDGDYSVNWHQHREGSSIETGLKSNFIITHLHLVCSFGTNIQDNLAILDEFLWHPRPSIDLHCQVGGKSLIHAPLKNCTNEVRFCGRH